MRQVKRSQITQEIEDVCPYCMSPVGSGWGGHCGESSAHFERGFEIDGEEIVLESEISIKEDE